MNVYSPDLQTLQLTGCCVERDWEKKRESLLVHVIPPKAGEGCSDGENVGIKFNECSVFGSLSLPGMSSLNGTPVLQGVQPLF